MDNKVIIEGEAPETDSEDEATSNGPETPSRMVKSVQGAIIAGEDSESDDDCGASVSSAVSALTQPPLPSPAPPMGRPNENMTVCNEEEQFNSLLHKKLRERNRCLSGDVQWLVRGVASEAVRSLTGSDQQLLRAQVTLQAGIASLRALNTHASLLRRRIHAIATSNFLPSIALPPSS